MRRLYAAAFAALIVNGITAAVAPERVHAQEYPAGFYFGSRQADVKPVAPPPPAHGPHAAEIMGLRARMDSLGATMRAFYVRDSIVEDSVMRARVRKDVRAPDTIPIGTFRLVGRYGNAQRLAPFFEDAWTEMAPAFKGVEDDIRDMKFVLLSDFERDRADSAKFYPISLRNNRSREAMAQVPRQALGNILGERLPASVKAWLAGNTVGNPVEMRRVQQALAFSGRAWLPQDSTHGTSDIKCLQGVPHDCRALLALSEVPINFADPALRASFITHVVLHAPPGSVARTANDSSAVIPALERLGGAPLDTLIARWLEYVNANNEGGFFHGGRLALATLVWTGIFGIMAMRSTRWRLG